MRFRIAQSTLAITIIVLVMLSPLLTGTRGWQAARHLALSGVPLELHTAALAQDDDNDDDNDDEDNADNDDEDNDDEDNDDDNDDEDNDDDNDDEDNADNDDGDNADNDDGDNADNEDADNEDGDFDNEGAGDEVSPGGPVYTFDPSVTEATGTSTGGDGRIALPGDRIVVQLFPWMPAGITLSIRMLDQASVPPPPGTVVDALIFQLDARDSGGFALSELPAEVNLSARYTDQAVAGRNELALILLWFDPLDQQWKPAPKLVTQPSTNYLAASVTGVGTYAAVIP